MSELSGKTVGMNLFKKMGKGEWQELGSVQIIGLSRSH